MKYFNFLCFLFIIACESPENTPNKGILQPMTFKNVYIGTYTGDDSKGIYHFEYDEYTGKLSSKKLAAASENPSFLAYSKDRKFLYAVNEIDNFEGNNSGAISSFKILKDHTLKLLNTVSSYGAHPCHLSVSVNNSTLVASNYTGGSFTIYDLNDDGSLKTTAKQIVQHDKGSHVHAAKFIKDKLFVTDLGLDAIFVYQKKKENYEQIQKLKLADKAGPRHFEVNNSNKMFVINELNNTISTIKMGKKLEILNSISTLDPLLKTESYCADIHLSSDGKFLYGSNRGENSLVTFEIQNDTLKRIENISVAGNWPRNFTFDPNEKHILVANQKSKSISIFERNQISGKLTFIEKMPAPTPVCILF